MCKLSKEDLLFESEKWSSLAINEVKNLLEQLMSKKDFTVEEVAEYLGWKVKKVEACLSGEGDLRIKDLSKLLIANDLVLEVKPSSETDITYGPEEEEDEDKRDWDEDDEEDNNEKEDDGLGKIKLVINNIPENITLEDLLKQAVNFFQKH